MDQALESTLWDRFRNGDAAAFAELYRLHYPSLLWFGTRYTQDTELVRDEIGQEFLQLWAKQSTLPEVVHVRNYLFTAVRNRLLNALGKAGKTTPMGEMTTEAISPSWEQELIGLEDRERLLTSVRAALQTLAPRQRELVFLKYFEGLSADEIAVRTGLTTRTVYNTLHVALQKLRDAVDPRHSAGLEGLLPLLFFLA